MNKVVNNLKLFKLNFFKNIFYRSFFSDLRINIFYRFFFFKKFVFKDINLSKNNLICKRTGRMTGIINGFFEFRMFFRKNNSFGVNPGIKKSSW